MDYYKTYMVRYAAADDSMKAASRAHWTRCHIENLKSGRHDLIIFSAQMLAAMDTVDAYRMTAEK